MRTQGSSRTASVGRSRSPNDEVTSRSPSIRPRDWTRPSAYPARPEDAVAGFFTRARGKSAYAPRKTLLQVHGRSVGVAKALQVAIQCSRVTAKGRLSLARHGPGSSSDYGSRDED